MSELDPGRPRTILVGGPSQTRAATEHALEEAGALLHVLGEDAAPTDLQAAARQLGGVDACVRFPPPPISGSLLEVPAADWAADLDRLLGGAHRFATAVAPLMAPGGGSIVLIASLDALHAYPGRSTAAAASAGLLGLLRSLAVELAAFGIRANAVLAGPMRDGAAGGSAVDSLETRTLQRSPSHRFVEPHEVASTIRFLVGPDSAFMTGQSIRVDGGWASLNQAPDGMRFP
jgi:3-oxoacyl-[acyl-carrier protein] reductase